MNKSESIKNIAKALAAFQNEVKNPANTAENPYFKSKYAPLNEILNDVRPLLAKHGLSVIQSTGGDGNNIVITTLIMHESGEWIESEPLVLESDTKKGISKVQAAGSAITYGRRYALSAMLGISSEDDTDGNENEARSIKQQSSKQQNEKNNKATRDEKINKIYELGNLIGYDKKSIDEKVKEEYGVSEVKFLKNDKLDVLLARLEKAVKKLA